MTATATSSRRRLLWLPGLLLVAVLAIAGCGGAGPNASGGGGAAQRSAGAFAWLSPAAPPAGWALARLSSGRAALAYPPGWRPIKADQGTFSAALLGPHGRIRGYLNATPRQGKEKLATWASFRTAHNADEGDRGVVRDAAARGLHFRSGTGSCVIDHYATVSAHYREIACLVQGSHASTVVVAAAAPHDWARLAPQLKRAISSFAT